MHTLFRFVLMLTDIPILIFNGWIGNLLNDCKKAVPDKMYHKFQKVYAQNDDVKMYLAEGYRKRHCYDEVTMEVKDYRMGEQLGVLLVYELPDTIKMKETESSVLCRRYGSGYAIAGRIAKIHCLLWTRMS